MVIKKEKDRVTRISVADFEIESSEAGLGELEECMNRLIKKNKDFARIRRGKIIMESQGMVG